MILLKAKAGCCGCSACKFICPQCAIRMSPDEEGFLYPSIDDSRCNNCGLCGKKCPFQNGYNIVRDSKYPFVYAARHKNVDELMTSQSGGLFAALSDYIVKKNGTVYGAGYTDHFRVVHKRATIKSEINEFKGSKYVQSDTNNTFLRVKEDLLNGYTVLFSGTPCQIAGLNAYLNNENTDYLVTCDIICYGVPSPYIWRDYLRYVEKKYNDTIIKLNFRDKDFGWASYFETFTFKRSKRKIMRNTYNLLFSGDNMIRPSCSFCKYTNVGRPSDITLGDYWGLERISPDFNSDNRGASLVLVNTLKGKQIFDGIAADIHYLESSIDKCLQPRLESQTPASPFRSEFWNDYLRSGFIYIGKKYGDLGWKSFITKKINAMKRLLTSKNG